MRDGIERACRSGRSTRREFLHRCAICAGAAALPPAWAKLVAAGDHNHHAAVGASPAPAPVAFTYFTLEQAATVEAITDQIIPADADPGAKWAGVVHYIDLALAGDLKEHRPAYEAGLRRLASLAREGADKPFAQLDFATQTKILEKLEADDFREGSGPSGREFFLLVRRQTLEGFFGDPKYGGNRDSIGWKILKFEG